jgi:hypothetical protein
MNKAVARAAGWAATSVAAVHDAYANALRLRLDDNADTADKLKTELRGTALRDREGAHWSNALRLLQARSESRSRPASISGEGFSPKITHRIRVVPLIDLRWAGVATKSSD